MYFESSQPFTFFTVHAIGQVPFCFLFITIHYTVYSTQYILPTLSNAHFFPLHACDCAVARQSNIYSTSYQPYQKFILYHVHACAVARQSNIYSTSYQLFKKFILFPEHACAVARQSNILLLLYLSPQRDTTIDSDIRCPSFCSKINTISKVSSPQ